MPRKAKETKTVEKASTKKTVASKATKAKATKTKAKKAEVVNKANAKAKVAKPKKVAEPKAIVVQDNRIDKEDTIKPIDKTVKKPKEQTLKLNLDFKDDKPKRYTTIGEYSQEIVMEHMTKMTDEEKEYKEFKNLEKAYYTGQLLWGTLDSIESTNIGNKKSFSFVFYWNKSIKIIVPEEWYWLENMYYSGSYYTKTIKKENGEIVKRQTTEEERTNIRMAIARNYIGAHICFVLKSKPTRQKIEGYEQFKGQYSTVAVASRLAGIEILRDKYFFHKNHKSEKEPITITKDSEVEAHVIGVKEDMVLVEAVGVETRLDCYSLSDDWVTDCNLVVRPGDDIMCKVLNLEIKDGNIKLRLSGRTKDTPKAIVYMSKNSWYNGKVIYYNEKTLNYTIFLNNGVRASVNKDRVQGYLPLADGDEVSVHVLKLYPDHVAGNCVKLRG